MSQGNTDTVGACWVLGIFKVKRHVQKLFNVLVVGSLGIALCGDDGFSGNIDLNPHGFALRAGVWSIRADKGCIRLTIVLIERLACCYIRSLDSLESAFIVRGKPIISERSLIHGAVESSGCVDALRWMVYNAHIKILMPGESQLRRRLAG